MRMILCDDIRLGALCSENLGAGLSRKWQDARTEKFRTLIEHATEERAEYISLFGNVFGRERVAETVLDGLFAMVKTAAEVQVLLFLNGEEYNRINYRSDKPENLHLICTEMLSNIYVAKKATIVSLSVSYRQHCVICRSIWMIQSLPRNRLQQNSLQNLLS